MSVELPAFERDPTLRRLETSVQASGGDGSRSWVVLEDTILYPEGGGQPSDRGTIDGVAVAEVTRVGGEIRHVLEGSAPAGRVTVELDWERRFDHMQQHTGQHLLTAIVDRRFGWGTTAFHLGESVCDIELDTPSISMEALADLEEAVASEIRAPRPVTWRRVSSEAYAALPVRSRGLPDGHVGSIRLVEISGIDLNTCGGTHCGSTAELEALKLLGTEPVRGGTRLFYVAGRRLRRLLGAHHDRNARLRALLGVPDEELRAAVEDKLHRLKDAGRALRELEEALAVAFGARLAAEPGPVVTAHWPGRDLPFLQRVARDVHEREPGLALFLTCGEGDGAFLLSAGEASTLDVASAGPRVAEILRGRGGGRGGTFQGKATGLDRRHEVAALLASHGEGASTEADRDAHPGS
jgi:Ser-tRNA(Ala) deacylase AlaX